MPQVGKSENSDYRARLQLFKNYADEIWGGQGDAPLDNPMSDSSVTLNIRYHLMQSTLKKKQIPTVNCLLSNNQKTKIILKFRWIV